MLADKQPRRKRGPLDVALIIIAAGLVMSPSYLAGIVLRRLNLDISIVAIMSLTLFLIGVLVLWKVFRD